jgi:hypothetical protein
MMTKMLMKTRRVTMLTWKNLQRGRSKASNRRLQAIAWKSSIQHCLTSYVVSTLTSQYNVVEAFSQSLLVTSLVQ